MKQSFIADHKKIAMIAVETKCPGQVSMLTLGEHSTIGIKLVVKFAKSHVSGVVVKSFRFPMLIFGVIERKLYALNKRIQIAETAVGKNRVRTLIKARFEVFANIKYPSFRNR